MEYQHGGDIYGDSRIRLDFSVNTNPFGMPEAVRQAVVRSADCWEVYPDCFCRRLRGRLAEYYGGETAGNEGFSREDFLCGNGASDLLYSLIYALRPRRALIPAPSFSEYEKALRAGGCEPVFFQLAPETGFSLEAEEERLFSLLRGPESVDMVIVGNPNNPNGLAVSSGWMRRLADCCREADAILVIDECFNWFLEDRPSYSVMELLRREPEHYRHVVVLNAFTKIYAMAGLRLGFLACRSRELMEAVENSRQPWSVSAPAEAAGLAALEQEGFVEKSAGVIACEREKLALELKKIGFHVFPSMTNYLLFRAGEEPDGGVDVPDPAGTKEADHPAAGGLGGSSDGSLGGSLDGGSSPGGFDYEACCRRQGILIRSCRNFFGMDDSYYRVAVRSSQDNEELLACLRAAKKEAEKGGTGRWPKRS